MDYELCKHYRLRSACPDCEMLSMVEKHSRLELAAEVVLDQLKRGEVSQAAILDLELALCKE